VVKEIRYNNSMKESNESVFKIGDWVHDGGDFGSIVSIDEKNQTVDLFDGKEGWTASINEIMPDRA